MATKSVSKSAKSKSPAKSAAKKSSAAKSTAAKARTTRAAADPARESDETTPDLTKYDQPGAPWWKRVPPPRRH